MECRHEDTRTDKKAIIRKINKYDKEESYWKQKSRVKFLKEWDTKSN